MQDLQYQKKTQTREKRAYFLSFFLMQVVIYQTQYIFLIAVILDMFQDLVSLFGGDSLRDDSLMHLPVELIFFSTLITNVFAFIFGWIQHLRWIGAFLMVGITLLSLALLVFAIDNIEFNSYMFVSFITAVVLIVPLKIILKHFQDPLPEERTEILSTAKLS